MAALFWISLALIAYAYAGYAVWLRLFAGTRPRVEAGERFRPAISIVVACRNERENLPRKIDNLERLAYLGTRPEILIASDGSTDGTAELLLGAADRVVPVILPESRGKAMALNAAVRRAKGEIVVFFDARQVVDERALIELAGCFADPEVGAVSGELLLEDPEGEPAGDALGLYWRIEKVVRRLESESGSVVGVTGAIYAIRRELYVELPEGTILDDVLVPMNVAHAGKRVMFQPTAIARDRIFQKPGKEFARKVRTLTGNYQLVQFAPWLVTFRNPLLFRFISHKLMRLAVPFLLVLLLVSSALARGAFYKLFLGGQLVFYGLAAVGWMSPSARRLRAVAVAETFTMLNLAAALAFYNFAAGRKKVWV